MRVGTAPGYPEEREGGTACRGRPGKEARPGFPRGALWKGGQASAKTVGRGADGGLPRNTGPQAESRTACRREWMYQHAHKHW